MISGTFIVVGSPSLHRIPLAQILSCKGMRVVEVESTGGALPHLSRPDSNVEALLLDLSKLPAEGPRLIEDLPADRKVPVIGIINPLTTAPKEAIAAGCETALSVFDTPEELLVHLSRSLFKGVDTRRNRRVLGYWSASLKTGGQVFPCRVTDLSREGAFIQTDWNPVDTEDPVEVTVQALPGELLRASCRVVYHCPCFGKIILGGVGVRFLEGFDQAERIVTTLSDGPAAAPVSGTPSILIADDDPIIRDLLVRIFGSQGWEIVAVPEGTEAVAEAKSRHFDAVLLDVEMAPMNGLEALEQIRSIRPEAAIALMTGGGARVEGAIREVMAKGPVPVLSKPFGLEELRKVFPKPR